VVDPVYSLHLQVRVRAAQERRAERRRRRRTAVLTAALVAGGASAALLLVRTGLPFLSPAAGRIASPPPVQLTPAARPAGANDAEPPKSPLQPPDLDEPDVRILTAVPGAPAIAAPSPPTSVRIAAVGDVAPGSTPVLPSDGGAELFARISSLLEGDVVFGNLEAALTDRTSSKCPPESTDCYAFLLPPSYASLLADAGFTVLSVANNHAFDAGDSGALDTVQVLGEQGVGVTGLRGQIAYEDAGGIRVGIVGFAPYGWTNDLLDLEAATALVQEAAERADIVVVAMHAGAEGRDAAHVQPGPESFLSENRGDPVRFAHAAIDAGADLVIGTGPHVLRGLEWYGGRLIAYSLGSFAGYRTFSIADSLGVSAVLRVSLEADGSWAGGDLGAVRLVGNGTPEPDPEAAALRLVAELSQEDFGGAAVQVNPDGSLDPPGSP